VRLFRTGSLALRLALSLLAVQVAVIAAWLLLLMTVSPYLSYDELAAASVQERLAAQLKMTRGGWVFESDARLDAFLARRPSLEWLVAADGKVVAASGSEFERELTPVLPLLSAGGELTAAEGGVIRASSVMRPEGRLLVATEGDVFLLEDLPKLFVSYLPQLLLMFAPALLAAAAISAWAVRRAMAGVREAAAAAAAIDLNSLDRRLSEDGLPQEVSPFVSAINRLLQRLEEGIRRRDLFMANAAHELRTPVAILSARIDGLEASDRGPLQRDVRRLTLLVDQLLSAARLRSRERADFARVDLRRLAQALLADMAPLAIRERRELELIAGDQPLWIWGDAEALRSALGNLVDNALRAEPVGGVISVRLSELPGGVRAEVVDHGTGVETDMRETIFEPFWRSRPSGQGSGLGLAIVRAVAVAHGGLVRVEPTPGGGATFVLELPTGLAAEGSKAIASEGVRERRPRGE
jgi:two-component system OmpR family sensor kinase